MAPDSDRPCYAFDEAPFIPLIDRHNNVVDAIRRFFEPQFRQVGAISRA